MVDVNPGQATGNPDGDEGVESFLSSISDEGLRKEPSLQSIKSLDDLAKGYVHAQRMVGRDKLPLPSAEDDVDGWNEVYNRLGRPEDPEKYDFGDLPVQEEAGYHIDKVYLAGYKKAAHANGLTSKQAKAMMEFNKEYLADLGAQGEMAFDKQQQGAERLLRREYGKTYEAKVDRANRVLDEFGTPELVERMKSFGLVNDPDMIRLMVSVAEQLGEDKFPHGEGAGGLGLTPDQAKAEIGKLKLDDKFMAAYTDRYHAAHGEAVNRMRDLYGFAFPE